MEKRKVVDVAGVDYEIIYYEPGEKVRGEKTKGIAGFAQLDKRFIGLEKGRPDEGLVLFHELLHTAWEVVGPTKQDEDFIRSLARILYSTVRNAGMLKEK